mgnify:CR=1 FL=1
MVTRVTSQAQQANSLQNIFRITENLFKAQQEIATGKRINKPSDDPAGIRNALLLRTSISQSTQFIRNININRLYIQATDSALDSVGINLIRAKELAISELGGLATAETRAFAANEFDQLISQILESANIKIKNLRKVSGELVGSIAVSSSKLKPIIVSKDIGKFIDELPILFVIAALTKGVSRFNNIGDLKHKESNRLLESKKILVQAGIKCKTTKGSMIIYGIDKIETQNKSILVKTRGDHRICMSSTILSLVTGISAKIENFETVNSSFPGFFSIIKKLGGKIVIK